MRRVAEINRQFSMMFTELRYVPKDHKVAVNNMICKPLHEAFQPHTLKEHAVKTFSRIFRTPTEDLILIDLNVAVEDIGQCMDYWQDDLMAQRSEALAKVLRKRLMAVERGTRDD